MSDLLNELEQVTYSFDGRRRAREIAEKWDRRIRELEAENQRLRKAGGGVVESDPKLSKGGGWATVVYKDEFERLSKMVEELEARVRELDAQNVERLEAALRDLTSEGE